MPPGRLESGSPTDAGDLCGVRTDALVARPGAQRTPGCRLRLTQPSRLVVRPRQRVFGEDVGARARDGLRDPDRLGQLTPPLGEEQRKVRLGLSRRGTGKILCELIVPFRLGAIASL